MLQKHLSVYIPEAFTFPCQIPQTSIIIVFVKAVPFFKKWSYKYPKIYILRQSSYHKFYFSVAKDFAEASN